MHERFVHVGRKYLCGECLSKVNNDSKFTAHIWVAIANNRFDLETSNNMTV